MPELPEVETTCRGIRPHVVGKVITNVEVRDRRLRWPVEDDIYGICDHEVCEVGRRAKYILVRFEHGTLMLHLGMSGSLRICPTETDLKKHDHLVIGLGNGMEMRLHDPRRFGAAIWQAGDGVDEHALISHLGPEPLENGFSKDTLVTACRGRTSSIKQTIMNNKVVVGVGNIYACEALYRSGIHPGRKAGRVSAERLERLVREIKDVLAEAITQGGTTLRDFLNESGEPGYFKQNLLVYDREGESCRGCGEEVRRMVQGGRSTFYCARCQR